MENVSPTLRLILIFKYSLEKGESVRTALLFALESEAFSSQIRSDLFMLKQAHDRGETFQLPLCNKGSIFYRHLLHLIASGLGGEPILKALTELENETYEACLDEMEVYCARLPVMALPPLLFCIFPAIMILILGPVVSSFFAMS